MIYLNNSTTTKIDDLVFKKMEKYQKYYYGFAVSDYSTSFELKSKEVLEDTKKIIAEKINAKPQEIFFTSGQCESNSWVLRGVDLPIITTKVEHSSIIETCKELEMNGKSIKYLDVDSEGFVGIEKLKSISQKSLVSVQHANQETGVIQDIKRIGKICKDRDFLFHVDASHSFLKESIDVEEMNIDFLTITAHLINGPKGIGALYIREGLKLKPLINGTRIFDVAGIAGFGEAVKIWKDEYNSKMKRLKNKLINGLMKIPNSIVFGSRERSIPNIVALGFKFVEGESIVLYLEDYGIILSTGSSCAGRGLKPSHVLEAMGYGEEYSHGSIRIGLSKYTKKEEIDEAIKKIREVVEKLRKMSPIKG